jgi:hypothetical protein
VSIIVIHVTHKHTLHRELLVLSGVCRAWRDLANRDELWDNLLLSTFSVSITDIQLKGRSHGEGKGSPKGKGQGSQGESGSGGGSVRGASSKRIFREMLHTLRALQTLGALKMARPVMPAFLYTPY